MKKADFGNNAEAKHSRPKVNFIIRMIVAIAIVIGVVTVSYGSVNNQRQQAQNVVVSETKIKQAESVSGSETNQIIGVWKMATNKSGEGVKIITKSRFIWTRTVNGLVVSSASGTYTFDGTTYIENIEFGTVDMSYYFGKKAVVKIQFDGEKMYCSGTLNENVPLNEVWERIE